VKWSSSEYFGLAVTRRLIFRTFLNTKPEQLFFFFIHSSTEQICTIATFEGKIQHPFLTRHRLRRRHRRCLILSSLITITYHIMLVTQLDAQYYFAIMSSVSPNQLYASLILRLMCCTCLRNEVYSAETRY